MLALRNYRVGADTLGYKVGYIVSGNSNLGDLLAYAEREYGFVILTKLIRTITPSFRIYLILMTSLTLLPMALYYRRESEYPLLSIALFVTVAPFSMFFSGMRQAIAISIGVIAWQLAKERRLIWFLVVVLLAAMFHITALILLLMYPIYTLNLTAKRLLFAIPVIGLVYIFNKPIFAFLSSFLWKEYEKPESAGGGGFTVLLLLVVFAVYSYFIPDQRFIDRETAALRNLLLLSITLQCFAPIHPLAMRLNYYFLIFIPVLIPKIAVRSKPNFRNLATASVLVMLVGFTVYFFYNAYTGKDILRIFPYFAF
jgi:hypothetical protein